MRVLAAVVVWVAVIAATVAAHDLERTEVTLSFAPTGEFVLDISNHPDWLLLRLESFAGGQVPAGITPAARDARLRELGAVFIDRVVLFVDGHEIRPASAEYDVSRAAFRLRGRMPEGARTLRWLYGAVIDPYRLTIRRADGRSTIESIEGSNWSGTIDLSDQFRRASQLGPTLMVVGVFLLSVVWRVSTL